MIKRILIFAFILLVVSNCASPVSYKITPDYKIKSPRSVAVLPVIGESAESDARYIFRIITDDKLKQLNYKTMPLEEIDERITKANIGKKEFFSKSHAEMADLLSVDAVLYVRITEWDTKFFLTYASIDMEAVFEMYARKTGERLWKAEYGYEDSDISIDRETLKLKITKIYQPMIQNLIDAVFTTLPSSPLIPQEGEKKEKKRYFEWMR